MLRSVDRPVTTRGRYYFVSVDAFLLTGAMFLLPSGLLALLFHQPSIWSELLSQAVLIGSLVGGTVLAWRLHGHALKGASLVGMTLGIVAGAVVGIPAVFALFMLGRFIPSPFPRDEGPWGLILVLAAALIAFLALPIYQGIRDLAHRTGSVPVAAARLGAFVIIATVIVITSRIGGDTAEAGIFMVPVSAASAAAIAGVAWFEKWRARSRRSRGTQ
jgi:hypothetical protein